MGCVPEAIDVGALGLKLRRWQMVDAPLLLRAIHASEPELRPWMPWAAETATLASVTEFLKGADVEMGFGLFEAGGDLVSAFGLHDRRGAGVLEIGYWVRTDRTGRGYATAAAGALTRTAFDRFPDVDRLEIRCHPANLASRAIPPKLGYVLDGQAENGHLIWARFRL